MPSMSDNLLSLGQLLEKCFSAKLEDKILWLFDGKRRLVLKAPMAKNRTFKVDIKVEQQNCLKAKADDEGKLWHSLQKLEIEL